MNNQTVNRPSRHLHSTHFSTTLYRLRTYISPSSNMPGSEKEAITNVSQEDCERKGSVGDGPPAEVPKVGLEDFPNAVSASVGLFSETDSCLRLTTTDGHNGIGLASGIGEGFVLAGGTLGYSSWDVLMSDKSSFVIAAANVDGLVVTFMANGSAQAVFVGGGIGEDISGGYGYVFTWA
ncbi:uncharacterized protein EDB91DRAFT_1129944 [Suillus paluster]|uniref:uncharacterized protein n=1 Tax=Suillus paluster TaxID=48578 RepID=UPI001B865168|nr:uncharacterized protein EDB91DRAFT_1129944 [Suillus paluster]KAG1741876.1 hypothetical protein EDB91DRAFT_1129944 [Suillus paluster]